MRDRKGGDGRIQAGTDNFEGIKGLLRVRKRELQKNGGMEEGEGPCGNRKLLLKSGFVHDCPLNATLKSLVTFF